MKIFLLFALSASTGLAELNLEPISSSYEVEGIIFPNVEFRDATRKIAYTPPTDWKLNGSAKKVSILPPKAVQAAVSIEATRMKEPIAAAEANFQAFRDLALASVPKEAEKAAVLETGLASLRIGNLPAIEVTLSYVFFGQPFRTNVLFVPRGPELVCFHLRARTSDFAELQKQFRSSLYSITGF